VKGANSRVAARREKPTTSDQGAVFRRSDAEKLEGAGVNLWGLEGPLKKGGGSEMAEKPWKGSQVAKVKMGTDHSERGFFDKRTGGTLLRKN